LITKTDKPPKPEARAEPPGGRSAVRFRGQDDGARHLIGGVHPGRQQPPGVNAVNRRLARAAAE